MPDANRYPLPDSLHEGQIFTLGGNGINDAAFYANKEPYYRLLNVTSMILILVNGAVLPVKVKTFGR